MALDTRHLPNYTSEVAETGFDNRDNLVAHSAAAQAAYWELAAQKGFDKDFQVLRRSPDKTARHHDYSHHKMYRSYEREAS